MSWPYPDFDAPDVEPDDSGYAYDDEISVSRMAVMYDTGKACAECFAEFTEPHGQPVSCTYCHRRGSEFPAATHPESNKEAHRDRARRNRKRKQKDAS